MSMTHTHSKWIVKLALLALIMIASVNSMEVTTDKQVSDLITGEEILNTHDTPVLDDQLTTDLIMANCGISVALNKEFMNKLLVELLPALFKYIQQTFSLGKTVKLDLEMFVLYLGSASVSVNHITYDLTKTRVELYSQNNSLGFHIKDSNLSVSMAYNLYVDPPILNDTGIMNVGYDNLNIDVTFGLGADETDPKKFAIDITESTFSVNPRDVFIKLNNTNDFTGLVLGVTEAIKNPMINLAAQALTDYMQEVVDLVLGVIPSPITIGNINADMSFYEFPNITDDGYATGTWVGKIYPTDKDFPYVNANMLPKWIPGGKGLQIFLSEFTMESLLYTVVVEDLINLNTPDGTTLLNTSYLSGLFPALLKYFGKNRPCRLNIKASQTPLPDIRLSREGLVFSLALLMKLEVLPTDEEVYVEAFEFKVQTDIDAILDIDKDLKIKMKVKELKVDVTEVIDSHIGEINIKILNNLITLLTTVIESLINTFLQRGFDLGWLIKIPVVLNDIQLSTFDGYYMIQANPYFEMSLLQKEGAVENLFSHFGLTSEKLFSADMFKNGLKNGLMAAYEVFDKEDHLNRPGMRGIKTIYNTYALFESIFSKSFD